MAESHAVGYQIKGNTMWHTRVYLVCCFANVSMFRGGGNTNGSVCLSVCRQSGIKHATYSLHLIRHSWYHITMFTLYRRENLTLLSKERNIAAAHKKRAVHLFSYFVFPWKIILGKESRVLITCLYKKFRSFRHSRDSICSIWSLSVLMVPQDFNI